MKAYSGHGPALAGAHAVLAAVLPVLSIDSLISVTQGADQPQATVKYLYTLQIIISLTTECRG